MSAKFILARVLLLLLLGKRAKHDRLRRITVTDIMSLMSLSAAAIFFPFVFFSVVFCFSWHVRVRNKYTVLFVYVSFFVSLSLVRLIFNFFISFIRIFGPQHIERMNCMAAFKINFIRTISEFGINIKHSLMWPITMDSDFKFTLTLISTRLRNIMGILVYS